MKLISVENCFVVCTSGYMLDRSTPDEIYTAEEPAEARAAAERDAAERKAQFPSLTFAVFSLGEYLSLCRESRD